MHRLLFLLLVSLSTLAGAELAIPPALQPWKEWVLADESTRQSPARFDNAAGRQAVWPSTLQLDVQSDGGRFELGVVVYDEAWVMLPGGDGQWPQEVRVNGQVVPVTLRGAAPGVKLLPGAHQIEGRWRWDVLPEHVTLPQTIGVMTLVVNGQRVESPNWDAQGLLWLQRPPSEQADQDQLGIKVYRLLADGVPMWLTTSVELTVTGKSREAELGYVLPDGWRVAKVASPLPCLVDDRGLLKVQVRPGTWTVSITAFRTQSLETFAYAEGVRPLVADELVAWQGDPSLRVVECVGLVPVDASQTTFPSEWRTWPVFAWKTEAGFRLEEKLRGMGMEKPAAPRMQRELWLDEDGGHLTFRDVIEGGAQQIWRLDVTDGQELGAVKSRGVSQLITRNPETHRPGVEVRDRALSLEAVGRSPVGPVMPATGWETVAGEVRCEWHLPPGWRLLALFGAEWVEGDWLTAWSLLDVFFLLIFSLAVQRVWGWRAGVVAFAAFVLSYHEPGAPRWTWLLVLVVLVAGRALAGTGYGWVRRWPVVVGMAVLALLWVLVPFVTRQVTGLLYPQLESIADGSRWNMAPRMATAELSYSSSVSSMEKSRDDSGSQEQVVLNSNLRYEQNAQIQTGPAVPNWQWRSVSYGWQGPVAVGQTIRPVLLSSGWQRVLIVIRLMLLGILLYYFFRRRNGSGLAAAPSVSAGSSWRPAVPSVVGLLCGVWMMGGATGRLPAQELDQAVARPAAVVQTPDSAVLPSAEWLTALRDRLLKPSDAFPRAAEIPRARLKLDRRQMSLVLDVHAAVETAVPLPGRLPSWSPLAVRLDGKPAPALQRLDGHVWVVVPAGVHEVEVTGVLPPGPEWEWAFLLAPRQVEIEAPGWTVTGVRPNGVPENQVFFSEQQAGGESAAAYDRRDFQPVVAIERHLELGLVWQVRTTARRLTDKGAAIALTIPLLPTERLLTSSLTVTGPRVEVRFGAQDEVVEWRSELTPQAALVLAAEVTDRWVERWYLEASPVWHVSLQGVAPLYEGETGSLIPVWRPWPGETVTLVATQPEAVAGQTMTVREVTHETMLGGYQRSATLTLDVQASIGHEMGIGLPSGAEVTGLTSGGQRMPVRMNNDQVMIPIRPGEQLITLQWTKAEPLPWHATVEALRLPVAAANVRSTVAMPAQRWVLWAHGPQRGPAVRFWALLVCALIFAWGLGSLPLRTLKRWEWALLVMGLTQTSLIASFGLIVWLFAVAGRGTASVQQWPRWCFNLMQLVLALGAFMAALVLVTVLHAGLLGSPHMFISGEGSSTGLLRWFQARSGPELPVPGVVSVSIWFYRLFMLAWALWLAFALLRWVQWGWQQVTAGGVWKSKPRRQVPPELPGAAVAAVATESPAPPAGPTA